MLLLKNALIYEENEKLDLLIQHRKIVAMQPNISALDAAIIDCENLALMPSFYNAHSHLDFASSSLDYEDFAAWHRSIFTNRAASKYSISDALDEMLASGVSHIGDICSFSSALGALANSGLKALVFAEILGANDLVAEQRLADLKTKLEHIKSKNLTPAISIHSPYSVSTNLAKAAVRLADNEGLFLSAHWAESAYEANLNDDKNPLAQSLKRFNPSNLVGEKLLDILPPERSQLVHCCYEKDFKRLENFAEIVHCARSNAILGCQTLSYEGENMALGTDGMSSNANMNFLDEMRAALFIKGPSNELAKRLLSAAFKRPFAKKASLKVGEIADIIALRHFGYDKTQLALQMVLKNQMAALLIIDGQIIRKNI